MLDTAWVVCKLVLLVPVVTEMSLVVWVLVLEEDGMDP